MVLESLGDATLPLDAISEIGKIGLWMQTVGIIIIIWIIVQIIILYLNRKRMSEIYSIRKDMRRIENKIDKMGSRKK